MTGATIGTPRAFPRRSSLKGGRVYVEVLAAGQQATVYFNGQKVTYHGSNPKCKDYSEEYQALYHEHMAKVLNDHPWIRSSHVWNMFDFGCAARNEDGVAGWFLLQAKKQDAPISGRP